MNKKINELYKKVNELMKAGSNFDVKQYEEILHDLEQLIGKELDRNEEEKMEKELAENVQRILLSTLEGKPTLDMIGIVEQIVTQAGGDYRALKTKYMNDSIDFFINYLGEEETTKTEDETGNTEDIYTEMKDALDETKKDDSRK